MLIFATVASVDAQSITAGAIAGTVKDSAGAPVGNARVLLTDRVTGFERSFETGRDGAFAFEYLPASTYDLFAEQLGFRPVRVRDVPANAGGETRVNVVFSPAAPPVDSVAERTFGGAFSGADVTGWHFGRFAMDDLPDRGRDVSELGRLGTEGGDDLSFEGLPSAMSTVAVDGVAYGGAGDPALPNRTLGAAPFALSSFNRVSLLPGGLDVEWGDAPGAIVSAHSVRGGNTLAVRAFGDWYGTPLAGSKYFEPQNVSHSTARGGLLVTGPVIRDTAQFAFGVEARHLQTPSQPVWFPGTLDSAVTAIAADSYGVNLGPYAAPRIEATDVVSGFGRFDWQLAQNHRITVRANVASLKSHDFNLGLGPIPAYGADLRGHDISTGASLTSRVSDKVELELRVGVDAGLRDYTADTIHATTVAAQPLSFGMDPALPGRFKEVGFTSTETLHAHLGNHRLKIGAVAQRSSYDYTFRYNQLGQSIYGDAGAFAADSGIFSQSVGPLPVTSFSPLSFGGFVQDRWRAGPGLDVIVGMRVEDERLSMSDVRRNAAWLDATGLFTDSTVPKSVLKFDPRFGLDWDVGDRHAWHVGLDAGLYDGTVGPGVLSDVIGQDGSASMRMGVGRLAGWPNVPDSTVAPPGGALLALLGPSFRAPRTGRIAFDIRGDLGGGTALQLGVTYRHTDFLPRIEDVNRTPAASGADQYGRPVYGTLTEVGGLIAATPGSNRRFSKFDAVAAINADGYSDYTGFTVRLDRPVGNRVKLLASYTHSRTKDNWLGALAGGWANQLNPFPDSLNGADWAEGTSDLDVPDRVSVGAQLDFRVFRLAGVYTYRTGYPFTPGFAPGVDANGDGSYTNDPAYVDESIKGITGLESSWPCLRTQAGRFAARNSCTGPGIHTLDARLVLGPVQLGYPVEIVVDALNLVEANLAQPDRALYLIDPAQALTTDPATGKVTVPLKVNPNFGKPAVRFGAGRILRLGIRVNYD